MTMNVRFNHPLDGFNRWRRRRESVVRLVRESAPDVLGCQEVTPAQRAYLQEQLGEDYVCLGVGRDEDGGGEQSTLLYRKDSLELLEWRTYWLSEHPDRPGSRGWDAALPRTCTQARLARGDWTILVLNAHLDHRGAQSRREAVRLMLRILEEQTRAGEAVAVLGDLNAQEEHEPVSLLLQQMQDAYRQVAPQAKAREAATFHAFLGPFCPIASRVDYIFVDRAARILEAEVIRRRGSHGGYPSDHYPVLARVEW